MYTNILIPTYESELAGKAVQHSIAADYAFVMAEGLGSLRG